MAAYAATFELAAWEKHAERHPVSNVRHIRGTVNLTNYNSTLAEISDITKHFRKPTTVIVKASAVTSNGYMVNWVAASKAFKAWRTRLSHSVDGPLIEAANDTNIGTFTIHAIGE